MLSPWARSVTMRLSSLRLLTRPVNATISSLERLASTEVVMKYTNLDESDTIAALQRYKLLDYAKDDKVHNTAEKLKELGISKEDIGKYPEILASLALTIDNHAHILKECGFVNLSAREIAFYRQLMTRRLALIRAHGYLPDKFSIVPHILSRIPDLPSSIAKEIEKKIGPVRDKTTLREIHKRIMYHYLRWKFQATPEQIRKIIDTYFHLRHRSLLLVTQCIDILTNQLGFTIEKILNHGYLISGHPDQIRETMKRVPTLGGLPLQEVIHKHPRILLMATDTLVSTTELFKQFGINDEAVRRCFMIYTLSTHTIKDRLIAAINDPQLGGFLDHPRVLVLILYSKTAAKRLNHLRQLQMRCYSLHLIAASSTKKFGKFTTQGEDFHRGYDTVHYIAQSLNCDTSNLRQALNRHPHWTGVPLPNVRATLLLLASRKFSPDNIREAVQLLLYPAEQVSEVLDSIDYYTPKTCVDWSPQLRYEHITSGDTTSSKITQLFKRKKCAEHDFSTGILDKIPSEDSTKVEFRLVLHTCLYLLEKPHHFTGNGIWIHNSSKEDKELAVSSG